jgi:hypothetical protein
MKKMKKKRPAPLAFHGFAVRARDPETAARRAAAILGWPVLRKSRSEIVLGDGPDLFLRIVRAARGQREGIDEIHLAVGELSKSGRKTNADALGGDSRTQILFDGVALTLREFKRAPRGKWRRRRNRV